MRRITTVCSVLCSLILMVIVGCGEDPFILLETLEISNIEVGLPSIGPGETTSVEAFVSYSGDETVLLYEWSADDGTVGGSDSRATYIAPGTPGTYFITLRVSDGAVSDERMVQVNVGQEAVESLILDFDTHWPATEPKDKLSYRVNIKSVVSTRTIIQYDITQDMDPFDAFLSIEIGQSPVLPETGIGAEQPSTAKRTIDEVDVSHIISTPGVHIITFYIRPGNRVQNGWLMNEAKIIGVQGTVDPLQ
ncbi:PKD domain-containing protein [Candidatus Poribacteria bacterium]